MTDRTIHDTAPWEPACAERHMGVWLYEPAQFRALAQAAIAGTLAAKPREVREGGDGPILYRVSEDGLALVRILGPMMKGDSKFGGTTNTIRTRQALRAAVADDRVRAIMLAIDSGGGTAAGTDTLGDEVAATADRKPTAAYIEDMGASAALWVATQAGRVSANRMAMIGSIGAASVVEDFSGRFEREGIKVHVVTSTGAETFKGMGAEGAPLTEEHLEEIKRRLDGLNGHFMAAVAQGRRMPVERVKELADGRVHIAAEAMRLGLIDAVETFEQAAAAALAMAGPRPDAARRRAADARVRMAEFGR